MANPQPVVGSQTASSASAPPSPEVEYTQAVRRQIHDLEAYFAKQITRYRTLRCVVIISAALVPVLATLTALPRWTLAAFGALAVAAEGIQGLYQFQRSALNAMSTANALERVLNKYMTATGPYAGSVDQVFSRFVEDVEKIREAADESFLQTWHANASFPSARHAADEQLKPAVRSDGR